jgi:hypothetical protein
VGFSVSLLFFGFLWVFSLLFLLFLFWWSLSMLPISSGAPNTFFNDIVLTYQKNNYCNI